MTQAKHDRCHWPDCDNAVRPNRWLCQGHLYRLPMQLRIRLERLYRPGEQSAECQAAVREAVEWIAANNKPRRKSKVNPYLTGEKRRWLVN